MSNDLIERLRIERDNWIEQAAQNQRNAEFYRGIVIKIGELFGEAAKTSDDGSIQEDVLALKVPELVESQAKEIEQAQTDCNANAKLNVKYLDRIAELKAVLMTESEKRDLLSKQHYRDRIAELEATIQRVKDLKPFMSEGNLGSMWIHGELLAQALKDNPK